MSSGFYAFRRNPEGLFLDSLFRYFPVSGRVVRFRLPLFPFCPQKRPFSWTGGRKWWFCPQKRPFSWIGRWKWRFCPQKRPFSWIESASFSKEGVFWVRRPEKRGIFWPRCCNLWSRPEKGRFFWKLEDFRGLGLAIGNVLCRTWSFRCASLSIYSFLAASSQRHHQAQKSA